MNFFSQRGSNLKQEKMRLTTINEIVKDKNVVSMDVCRMIYDESVSFNLVKSPYINKTMEFIGNYGKGYDHLSYHKTELNTCRKSQEN